MTSVLILSSALSVGPNPVVTGAGEEITVTKHLARPFISIRSKATGGNVIEVRKFHFENLFISKLFQVDNGATNGVIHVVDVVLS